MGRNDGARDRAIERYYQGNPLKACSVCGRLFIRRRDTVCSRACLEKSQASENQSAPAKQ
jgi:hypothetical protein